MHSIARPADLDAFGANKLNELRVQYAHRASELACRTRDSGTGPAINVTGVAGFGGPIGGTVRERRLRLHAEHDAGDRQLHRAARQARYKAGVDLQYVVRRAHRGAAVIYTFPTTAGVPGCEGGHQPLRLHQLHAADSASSDFNMSTNIFSAFVQDDWQRRVEPEAPLRPALRPLQVPGGTAERAVSQTHEFNIDRNNFAPRVGAAWPIGETDDGAARQHRHHVRPDAARRSTSRRCSTTAPTRARLHLQRRRQAGAPAFPAC